MSSRPASQELASSNESSIAEYCRDGGITPIAVDDFARLIELYPSRSISPATLEDLFESRHTPLESKAFVDKLEQSGAARPRPPVDLLLGIIDDFSSTRAPVSIKGLPTILYERSSGSYDYTVEEVRAMIDGLRSLAPTGIWSDSEWVALQTSPDQVKAEIRSNLDELSGAAASGAREAFDVGT